MPGQDRTRLGLLQQRCPRGPVVGRLFPEQKTEGSNPSGDVFVTALQKIAKGGFDPPTFGL